MRHFYSPYLKLVVATAITGSFAFHVYDVHTAPSKFELAAQKLNITVPGQEGLLRIFTMAGYFEKQQAWQDLNRSKIFEENTKSVFTTKFYPVIHISGADKANPNEVDVNYLKQNFFGKSKKYFWEKNDNISVKQVEDWILYEGQNAFARKTGQERSELQSHNWMTKYKAEFFSSAKTLGMIDRIDPIQKLYDEAWIAGASRPGVFVRIMDYKWMLDHGVKVQGNSMVLAGARPLWAEIDGMNNVLAQKIQQAIAKGIKIDDIDISVPAQANGERIEEGKKYIISLAAKLNIPLDPSSPMKKCDTKSECPAGFFPGRTYPNYVDINGPKIDESKMSVDVLNSVLGTHQLTIIDTKAEGSLRPTTETTARDAVQNLIEHIKADEYQGKKAFYILFISNNPYIERQTLAAQRVVNDELKKTGLADAGYRISLEGVGFRCKQDVTTVYSELGALIAEEWKNINTDEQALHLMYQTRDNTSIFELTGESYE